MTGFQALSMKRSSVHATWVFLPMQPCVLMSPHFHAYLQSIAFHSFPVSAPPSRLPALPSPFLPCQYWMSLLRCWKSFILWNVVSRLLITPSHPTHAPRSLTSGAKFCSLIQPSLLYRVSECHYAVAEAARAESWSWRAALERTVPFMLARLPVTLPPALLPPPQSV